MKTLYCFIICWFCGMAVKAQEVNLSDSVIFFGNKPVAYYVKMLNESEPRYDVFIISLDKKLLMAAKVVKFNAPIKDLKPFYYYDLILESTNDTLSIYYYGQAFTIELAELLKKYNLLSGNEISKAAWKNFKRNYEGSFALNRKISGYIGYLVEKRFLNEQALRDRTKPVTIVNDKIIMQDGKKIGLIVPVSPETKGSGAPLTSYDKVTMPGGGTAVVINTTERPTVNTFPANPSENFNVQLPSDRIVDPSCEIIEPVANKKNRSNAPKSLFDISLPYNTSAANENALWIICQYIEAYLL